MLVVMLTLTWTPQGFLHLVKQTGKAKHAGNGGCQPCRLRFGWISPQRGVYTPGGGLLLFLMVGQAGRSVEPHWAPDCRPLGGRGQWGGLAFCWAKPARHLAQAVPRAL